MSSIKCLERALDILELMYKNGGRMTLTEISKGLDLYKSTVLRTLVTLTEKDFIQRDKYTGAYSLGSRVFMLGLIAAHSIPIARIARPQLEFLSEKYDEYAELSVLDNGIDRSEREQDDYSRNFIVVFQQYMNDTYSQTLITPEQCESSDVFLPAVYMCFLAYGKFDGNDELLKTHFGKIMNRCSNKRWTYEEFSHTIKEITEKGYSYQEADVKSGQTCLAAPIFDHTGSLIAVLSLRMTKTKLHKFGFEQVMGDITSISAAITEQCRKI